MRSATSGNRAGVRKCTECSRRL